jgi:lysozyme family protein
MADTFAACLAFTLQEEGGFTNDPNDPGGATNHGITLATLRGYLGDDGLGVDDIRNIDMATVNAIYHANYWNRLRCDALPAGIDLMVFDHGVNTGTGRAGRMLQQAAGMTGADVDGAIGPRTLAAVARADPAALIADLGSRQRAYYQSLPGFVRYGNGWMARLGRRQTRATAMVAGP